MKKTILVALVSGGIVASGFSQGIINFSAGVGKIKFSTDGGVTQTPVPAGNPDNVPGFGAVTITFYSAANGTVLSLANGVPNLSAWSIATTLVQDIAPAAGAVPTTSVTLAAATGSAGATEEVEMVAWTGNFTSFAQAVTGGALVAWTGSPLSGGALGWSQPTGTAQSPVNVVTGAGGYNSTLVMAPVPEPTTIALGGLGAAALLLFRRRK